jgi:hypothetical protein
LTFLVPLIGSSDWSNVGRLRVQDSVGSSTAGRTGIFTPR